MQIEANKDFSNITALKKPCRRLRLSEPEFRALKKLARGNEKTVDEEIFSALELWGKACGTERDLSFWSETEPRFKCLHGSVDLSYCSESEPDLIEAAIRRHIHDFDTNAERGEGLRLNETLIVTVQLDEKITERLWTAKRKTGKSLSSFVEGVITDFICHLENSGVTYKNRITLENKTSYDSMFKRRTSLETFHISLSKKIIEQLCRILQFNRSEVERAVILALNWRLSRA